MRIYNWQKYFRNAQYEHLLTLHDMDSVVDYLKTLGFKETKYSSDDGLELYIVQEMFHPRLNIKSFVSWGSSQCIITVRFT